jgi:hypothetical protein
MKKLNKHILLSLLLLTLLAASLLPQVEGQARRRHHRRGPAAPAAVAQAQPKFKLECTLPALTSDALPIDMVCGKSGNSASGSNSAKQNVMKNRFCLPGAPTTPIEVDFDTFDTLQKAARQKHIPFGRIKLPNGDSVENLPPNRSLLVNLITDANGEKLGEGKLVTLEGFIFKARHSNVGAGESVNCKKPKLADNDIHIALARTKAGAMNQSESSECETVTAEITPHHRSEIYNRFDTLPADFLNGKPQKPGEDKLEGHPLPLPGERVRLTGQLFFDGSHSPCRNGHGGPPRRSIWEIHPVYAIDVFDTTQNKFISFEEWAQQHSN